MVAHLSSFQIQLVINSSSLAELLVRTTSAILLCMTLVMTKPRVAIEILQMTPACWGIFDVTASA